MKNIKNVYKKGLKNIQLFEHELVVDGMLYKNITNIVYQHYVEKPHIVGLPTGRPNKRIASFTYNRDGQVKSSHKLLDFDLT
jgi:hypothetical protein